MNEMVDQRATKLTNGDIGSSVKVNSDGKNAEKSSPAKVSSVKCEQESEFIQPKVETNVKHESIHEKPATKKLVNKNSSELTISDDETGFPPALHGHVIRGNFLPINKKTWSTIDIKANDAILDCASQVVPLMIKKPTVFPSKLKTDKNEDDVKEQGENEDVKGRETVVKEEPRDEKEEEKSTDSTTPKPKTEENKATMLTMRDFYQSSVGKLLTGIGLSRCMEWVQRDNIKQIQRQLRKEGEISESAQQLKLSQSMFNQMKNANSVFTFKMNKCGFCDFRTESVHVMAHHMSIPHLTTKKEYRCNYCLYLTKDHRLMLQHYLEIHRKPCTIEPPPSLYECIICPHESNQKGKSGTHLIKCMKTFNPNKVMFMSDLESDYPTITPKPITKDDINVYEATLQALRTAAFNPSSQMPFTPGLPRGLQLQMLAMQQQQLAQKNRALRVNKDLNNSSSASRTGNSILSQHSVSSSSVSGSAAASSTGKGGSSHLYHMLQSGAGHTQVVSVPSQKLTQTIHINTPVQKIRGPMQNNDGKGGSFVICEICDGYIKDLEQLRTHMHWIHKVKIHPKMLASRPPLNCQKCQWRFFTDQGLERHLLGAHGLVTSNMQSMVDQNQDKGRCTICGCICSNKLVAHMNQVHKITLRPAHLSYKCTVCSATFNLYRLFENHVYMVHNGSVKRSAAANDDQNVAVKKAKLTINNSVSNDRTRKSIGGNTSTSDVSKNSESQRNAINNASASSATKNGNCSIRVKSS